MNCAVCLAASCLDWPNIPWTDEGNRAENLMIDDLLRNDLSRIPYANNRLGTNEPAMQQIMLASGLTSPAMSEEVRQAIATGVADVGLEDDPFDLRLRDAERADRPWRDRILDYPDIHGECRNLTAACYIVGDKERLAKLKHYARASIPGFF